MFSKAMLVAPLRGLASGFLRKAPNNHTGQPMSDHLARVTAALGAREVEGKGPRMIPISA